MGSHVLKMEHISKTFHQFTALKDVSISVERGKIYGLIGKNGAGKTSLMRIITGLSIPTSGDYELFGYRKPKDIQAGLKQVGSLIEHPSLNGNMTAAENLTLHKTIKGIRTKNIEHELLALVGLTDTGKKKAKHFSLGMKQRLGLAISLLGEPEFLILDEPINGLDPLGVVEIRQLIKKLCAERGMTILVSSHHLTELYQTATDYIIIDQGEVIQTMSQVALEKACQSYVHIETKQTDELKDVLDNHLHTTDYSIMDDGTIRLFDLTDEDERVARTLCANDIIVTRFSLEGQSLESYFTQLVGGDGK